MNRTMVAKELVAIARQLVGASGQTVFSKNLEFVIPGNVDGGRGWKRPADVEFKNHLRSMAASLERTKYLGKHYRIFFKRPKAERTNIHYREDIDVYVWWLLRGTATIEIVDPGMDPDRVPPADEFEKLFREMLESGPWGVVGYGAYYEDTPVVKEVKVLTGPSR